MSVYKITKRFYEEDWDVADVESAEFYLKRHLMNFSEGLWKGETPILKAHIPLYEEDFTDREWMDIRANFVTPRTITKMLWQGVYEFKCESDFNMWLRSWPTEVVHYAQAVFCWETQRRKDIPLVSMLHNAQTIMMKHPRKTVALLIDGLSRAAKIMKHTRNHWFTRRKNELEVNGFGTSYLGREWAHMVVVEEDGNKFQSIYYRPQMDLPMPVEERTRETLGLDRFRGWGNVILSNLGAAARYIVGRREPVIVEAQCDEEPPSLTSKEVSKMCNIVRNFTSVLVRHQDKMYKLCKRGRFAENQGDWDIGLFHRQRKALEKAIDSFRFSSTGLPGYDNNYIIELPWNYSEQSTEARCKIYTYMTRMFKRDSTLYHNFIRCVQIVNTLDDLWRDAKFDGRRCFMTEPPKDLENVMKHISELRLEDQGVITVEAQADEEKPMLGSSADGTTGKPAMNLKKPAGGADKDTVTTDGEQKTNLVLADSRSVAVEKVKVASMPKTMANSETNNNMASIMKRPMLIGRYTWNEATGEDMIKTFIMPQAYFSQSAANTDTVCQPLTAAQCISMYGYTRFNINVRIQVNASKFVSGLLLVFWEPFLTTERDNIIDKKNLTNFQHVWINASSSNSAEMVIPWQNHRDYFPVYADSHAEYNYWGRLHLKSFTGLRTGEKTSSDASISVYMHLTDWEVHQQVNPKPVETVHFATDILPDSYNYGRQQGVDFPSPMQHLVGKPVVWTVEPQMNEVVGAILPELGTIAMEALANRLSRVSADKPAVPSPATKQKLEVMGTTAHGDGPDVTTSLSLTSKRVTPMKTKLLDTYQPSTLKDLLKMESLLVSFDVTTANKEGDVLKTIVVSPSANTIGNQETINVKGTSWEMVRDPATDEYTYQEKQRSGAIKVNTMNHTMLSYVSSGFLWYTGGIRYRLIAVKTDMHTVRLGIRYEPTGTSETAKNECQKVSTPGIIWDLSEQRELQFTAEYAAPQPFLSTKYCTLDKNIDKAEVIGNYASGIIEFYLVNQMKVTTGVSQAITIHVFISAADSFELSGLNSLREYYAIGKNYIPNLSSHDGGKISKAFPINYGRFLLTYLFNTDSKPITWKRSVGAASLYTGTGVFPIYGDDTKFEQRFEIMDKIFKQLETSALLMAPETADPKITYDCIPWEEESAKTYRRACEYLVRHQVGIPEEIDVLLNHDERVLMWTFMVLAHMRHYVFKMGSIPSMKGLPTHVRLEKGEQPMYIGYKPRPVTVEAQADDVIESKASRDSINPFKDGVNVDHTSVKQLNGEGFNDMYQICRRYYPMKKLTIPIPLLDGRKDLPGEAPLGNQWIGQMNDYEYENMYWAIGIPVHPYQKFEAFGHENDAMSMGGNKNRVFSVKALLDKCGFSAFHQDCYTQLHLYSACHTYWRGDLRQKAFIPGDEELFGYVCHQPQDYGELSVEIVSDMQVRQSMNYGTILYKGNVMGGFEYEIPWQQKYSRLLLSDNRRSAITDNGKVYIYIPVQRKRRIEDKENPRRLDLTKDFQITLFSAFGDNTELLIPRAAPRCAWWSYYVDNFGGDGWKEGPHDFIVWDGEEKNKPMNLEELQFGKVTKHVKAYQSKETTAKPWLAGVRWVDPNVPSFNGYHKVHTIETEFGAVKTIRKIESFQVDRFMDSLYKPTVTVQAQTSDSESEEEDEATKLARKEKEQMNAAKLRSCFDGAKCFKDFAEKVDENQVDVVDGGIESAVKGLTYVAHRLPETLDLLNSNLEKAQKTWSLSGLACDGVAKAASKVASMAGAASFIGKTGYDAARVGIIMYAFYNLMNAENWQERMMAITTGALALGLSIDAVRSAGNWILSNISALFGSKEVNENPTIVRTEASEDESGSMFEFLADHMDVLKLFAAGVGAMAVFTLTKDGPDVAETGRFAGSMMKKLKNFSIVGRAVQTFDWLFKWISKLITSAFDWACDLATGGMLTKKILADRSEALLKWIVDIEYFNEDSKLISAMWNMDARTNFWKLFDQGEEFTRKFSECNSNFVQQTLQRGMLKLQALENKLANMTNHMPCRIDPFCIWIHGEAGVGKSASAATTASFLGDHMGWAKHKRTYAKNEKDDFWPNYVGQKIIFIDDICQFKVNEAVQHMIKMKTNVEYLLNMSESNEKGRRFCSELIICTSNHLYPKPEEMSHPMALWRRRNILVTVVAPPGVKGGDYTKLTYQVRDPRPPEVGNNQVISELSYSDFLAFAFVTMRRYLSEQRALVYSCIEGRAMMVTAGEENEEEFFQGTIQVLKSALATYPNLTNAPGYIENLVKGFTEGDWSLLSKMDPEIHRVYNRWIVRHRTNGDDLKDFPARVNAPLRVIPPPGQDPVVEGADVTGTVPKTVAAYSIDDDERADYEQVCNNARDLIEQRTGLKDAFLKLEKAHYRAKPIGRMRWYKDENELRDLVKNIDSHLTPEQQEVKVKDLQKVADLFFTTTKVDVPNTCQFLADPDTKKFITKNKDGKWDLNFKEEDITLSDMPTIEQEHRMSLMMWWTDLKMSRKEEEVQRMCEVVLGPKPGEKQPDCLAVRLTKNWCAKMKEGVSNFFENHPYITSILKMAMAIGGLFAGYRVLRYLCPDIVCKIEGKLGQWFSGVKESAPVQYATEKVARGVEWSSELQEKIKNYFRSNKDPVLMALPESDAIALVKSELTKLVPAAVAGVALRGKMVSPEAKELLHAYYSGETKFKNVVPKNVAVANSNALVTAVAQGAYDQTSANVREAVSGNMCRLIAVHNGKLRRLGGVFLKGRFLMCPLHFVDGLDEGDEIQVMCGTMSFREQYNSSNWKRIDNFDAVIYEVSKRMPFKRDITGHFATEADLSSVKQTGAFLNILGENMEPVMWMTTAKVGPHIKYDKQYQHEYPDTRNWEYEVATTRGDCGGLLFANNTSLTRKIIGMHVAGVPGKDLGFAIAVTFEDITKTLTEFPDDGIKVVHGVPECLIEEGAEPTVLPNGNFTIIGKAKPGCFVRLPEKTEIRKSPIHGLVREPVTEPAILTPKDPRWIHEGTPLIKAISKYGVQTVPFEKKNLQLAREYLKQEISGWKVVMEPRLLTDHEAVFGNEYIPFCDRMNMDSSPGYPFVLKRPKGEKGKSYLYDINDPEGIADEEYREKYHLREEMARKGEAMPHIWTACLKDERRPKAKIEAGKTRTFTVGSADFTQLVRKYFMAFNVNFYANNGRCFSAVGMDPYSYQWTKLWRRMTKKGRKGFSADYSNYDGILDPDLMYAYVEEVNDFYGPDEDPANKVVRRLIMEDCIHSYILMYNTFIQKHTGNPSGNPQTTPLNTGCNLMYLVLAWLDIMSEVFPALALLMYFEMFVTYIFYGDDGLLGVSDDVAEYFNLQTVSKFFAEHGITYTDECKSVEGLYTTKPLAECTFLKNGFKRMAGRHVMLAPIAEDTIFELTNWVRASEDDVAQMRANFVDVFKFAFHHGKDFFEMLKSKVNSALISKRMRTFPVSYEAMRDEFLEMCSF